MVFSLCSLLSVFSLMVGGRAGKKGGTERSMEATLSVLMVLIAANVLITLGSILHNRQSRQQVETLWAHTQRKQRKRLPRFSCGKRQHPQGKKVASASKSKHSCGATPHRAPTHNKSRSIKCKELPRMLNNYHSQLHSSSELPTLTENYCCNLSQAKAVEMAIPTLCSHLYRCSFPPRASRLLARCLH